MRTFSYALICTTAGVALVSAGTVAPLSAQVPRKFENLQICPKDKAIARYQKAIEKNPDDPRPKNRLKQLQDLSR